MRKKRQENKQEVEQQVLIVDQDYESYVAEALDIYKDYVNIDRHIPDYRDGLKPVQRRSLWSMYQLGVSTSKFVKCAS